MVNVRAETFKPTIINVNGINLNGQHFVGKKFIAGETINITGYFSPNNDNVVSFKSADGKSTNQTNTEQTIVC